MYSLRVHAPRCLYTRRRSRHTHWVYRRGNAESDALCAQIVADQRALLLLLLLVTVCLGGSSSCVLCL
jgi:hypothetical protein